MADLFVERCEELAGMTRMNTQVLSRRQKLLAERVVGYGAEQRRLKAAASERRTAAASAEATDGGAAARRWRPPAVADRGAGR